MTTTSLRNWWLTEFKLFTSNWKSFDLYLSLLKPKKKKKTLFLLHFRQTFEWKQFLMKANLSQKALKSAPTDNHFTGELIVDWIQVVYLKLKEIWPLFSITKGKKTSPLFFHFPSAKANLSANSDRSDNDDEGSANEEKNDEGPTNLQLGVGQWFANENWAYKIELMHEVDTLCHRFSHIWLGKSVIVVFVTIATEVAVVVPSMAEKTELFNYYIVMLWKSLLHLENIPYGSVPWKAALLYFVYISHFYQTFSSFLLPLKDYIIFPGISMNPGNDPNHFLHSWECKNQGKTQSLVSKVHHGCYLWITNNTQG